MLAINQGRRTNPLDFKKRIDESFLIDLRSQMLDLANRKREWASCHGTLKACRLGKP